jgi:hypothetical protein
MVLRYVIPLLPILACSLPFIAVGSLPAQALDAMNQIQMNQALGQAGNLPIIPVPLGHSVNLSFLKTNQQVQAIWVDDPSRVVVSTDTPLGQSGGQSGTGGASIIRIRQMDDPINFPSNVRLSYTAGGSNIDTLLTVITTSGNQRAMYQFTLRLTTGSRGAASAYEVVPSLPSASQPQPVQRPQVLLTVDRERLSKIRAGLAYAQAQGMMDMASPEYAKLQSFLSIAASGQRSIEESMQQSGVSTVLIDKLIELSGRRAS